MSMNPKVKNPLILTVVSTVFLIPVLILTHFLFRDLADTVWLIDKVWLIMIVDVLIYFVLIFLVFLYYGNIGKK